MLIANETSAHIEAGTARRLYSQAELDAAVAAERERCAKVCEDYAKHMLAVCKTKGKLFALDEACGAEACAAGIRA